MSCVLITGVSSGIGNSLARGYLQRDWSVLGLSRRQPEDLCQHEQFRFESVDVRDEEKTAAAIARLMGDIDRLDLAVLNAGILGPFGDLQDISLDELRNVMDVNVWANKTLIDAIVATGVPLKQVVAISSGAAVSGNRGWSGYGTSKAALNMLTQLYSHELPEIHFTALAPGTVDTAMQNDLCGRDDFGKFETLRVLRSKRNTEQMPTPEVAADRLIPIIERLPELVKSGDFADVRKSPLVDVV